MWIFWISFFILSSMALFVFIKQHKSTLTANDNAEVFVGSSVLFKKVVIWCIHSRMWLVIVNNVEKALRKIRVLFLKFDNFFLNIIDKVRGHSSKIVQKNLENQENAFKNKDSEENTSTANIPG